MTIPAWQLGKLRNQYFVEQQNLAALKEKIPTASVVYVSITPKWIQNTGFCPKWSQRVNSLDFVGLFENEIIETDTSALGHEEFLAIKSNLKELRSLNNLLLWSTLINDETLIHLEDLEQIERLDITRCKLLTNAGIEKLHEKRPDLQITESVSKNGKTSLETR